MCTTPDSGRSADTEASSSATASRSDTSQVARTAASSDSTSVPAGVSVSSRTIRSGFSACATRTRPQTAAAAGSVTSASPPAGTAPRVTTTSRVPSSRGSASQAWTTLSVLLVSVRAAVSSTPSATQSNTAAEGSPAPFASAVTSLASVSAIQSGTVRAGRGAGSSVHSTRNRASAAPGARSADARRSAETGRRVTASAVSTGPPVSSAASTDTTPVADRTSRARSTVAPVACRTILFHSSGCQTCVPSPATASRTAGCRTASSSAGCTPYRSASVCSSSASAASANSSSPRRHRPRRPWKRGP